MSHSPALVIARNLTFAVYSLILLAFCVWQITRPDGPRYFAWIVQLVPLLIFLPGLLRNNPRAHIGLCFVLLLYFIKAVEGVFSPARAWIDYALLTLTVVLFIVSMLTSRWLQRPQKTAESAYADSP